jgi:hypothetical protein
VIHRWRFLLIFGSKTRFFDEFFKKFHFFSVTGQIEFILRKAIEARGRKMPDEPKDDTKP